MLEFMRRRCCSVQTPLGSGHVFWTGHGSWFCSKGLVGHSKWCYPRCSKTSFFVEQGNRSNQWVLYFLDRDSYCVLFRNECNIPIPFGQSKAWSSLVCLASILNWLETYERASWLVATLFLYSASLLMPRVPTFWDGASCPREVSALRNGVLCSGVAPTVRNKLFCQKGVGFAAYRWTIGCFVQPQVVLFKIQFLKSLPMSAADVSTFRWLGLLESATCLCFMLCNFCICSKSSWTASAVYTFRMVSAIVPPVPRHYETCRSVRKVQGVMQTVWTLPCFLRIWSFNILKRCVLMTWRYHSETMCSVLKVP